MKYIQSFFLKLLSLIPRHNGAKLTCRHTHVCVHEHRQSQTHVHTPQTDVCNSLLKKKKKIFILARYDKLIETHRFISMKHEKFHIFFKIKIQIIRKLLPALASKRSLGTTLQALNWKIIPKNSQQSTPT